MKKSELLKIRKELEKRKKDLFNGAISQIKLNLDNSTALEVALNDLETKEIILARADATVRKLLSERFQDKQGAGLRQALKAQFDA